MTKKERSIILKACELLETGKEIFSCWALAYYDGDNHLLGGILTRRYGAFYERSITTPWLGTDISPDPRILLLLNFMEGEKYV